MPGSVRARHRSAWGRRRLPTTQYPYRAAGSPFVPGEQLCDGIVIRINVLRGSSQTYDFTPDQWLYGTQRILEQLAGTSRNIGILRATPVLPVSGQTCVSSITPLREWLTRGARCTSSASNAKDELVADALSHAAQGFQGVHLIDMNDAVCPNGTCQAVRDGVLVFRDTQHLTAEFAETMADAMQQRIRVVMPELVNEPAASRP
ncbi:SGNH hydrolase domain-containing protein [Xanthomonadaceae bacterium XH05]|nr:SGNH hydrolase domain-containing protein [Xanthomonadaceae bacterium XH05]